MGAKALAIAATGQTVQGVLMDMLTGNYWNGSAMEAYNSGHWGNYNINMPEDSGSGRYIWTMPGGVPAGNYWLVPYLLSNPPTPALGADNALDIIRIGWDGGNIVDIGSGLNVTKINGSAPAAANLAVSSNTFVVGAAVAGTLTTATMTTNLSGTVANMYAGRTLIFTSGANAGFAVLVTAYVVTGGKLTFIAYNNMVLPVAPSIGDAFIIF